MGEKDLLEAYDSLLEKFDGRSRDEVHLELFHKEGAIRGNISGKLLANTSLKGSELEQVRRLNHAVLCDLW